MTNTKLTNQAQIEGLLFISGDEGITLGDLAKISGFMKPAVLAILQELKKKYIYLQMILRICMDIIGKIVVF